MKKILILVLLLSFSPKFGNAQPYPLPTLDLLKALIRINTTNPPGNESQAMHWVADYLKNFEIDSEIIEAAPGRGNLIAKISGKGQSGPLMLLAHLDVVMAEDSEWSSPPFEPVEKNGYLYGRSAIDMKGQAALMIATFVQLKLQKIPLKGDVLLVLVADEEAGGKFGAGFLTEKHWEKIKPAVVINEGSIGLIKDGMHLYPIQVAEKGVAWLKITATGTSGHGSMPIPDNATLRLIKALNKIASHPQPIQKTAIVEEMLARLASQFSFPRSFFLRHFFDFPIRQLAPLIAGSKIESDKILNAMLRNTIVPTVLKAGTKTNVIPSIATAEVDCRLLPGVTPKAFRQKIIERIDDDQVQVDLLTHNIAGESNFHTPYFKALEEAIRSVDPKAVVFPFISPGATDNRFFRDKGVLAYGIIPLLITMEDLDGLHGKDERIPLAEIPKGEKILLEFVKRAQGLN